MTLRLAVVTGIPIASERSGIVFSCFANSARISAAISSELRFSCSGIFPT
nr:MAG TPA: hypothetical protein [Caudoviricetes sp.]DAV90283.1 MAG TPA: hypothetical protein [Caudoviricetes sp.]